MTASSRQAGDMRGASGAEAAWLSFVPRHVVLDLLERPAGEQVGRERRFEAVTLFADISGFTPMSEALGTTGRRGTEELTTILNSYFAPTMDLIERYGGVVGKFGGDALTVLFPLTPRSRRAGVQRAITCALDMRDSIDAYNSIGTSAGVFALAIKIGLALGQVFTTSVGDPEIRLEFVLGGPAIDRCCEAERLAAAGEILVDASVLEAATGLVVDHRSDSFAVARGLARRASPARIGRAEPCPPRVLAAVRPYLHASVAERVVSQTSDFLNEHRNVTIVFGRFAEFDYDNDPDAVAKLQRYLAEVIRLVDRYGGHLAQVDMGDKGNTYMVLFGTPIAHEDDEARAVRCALELRCRSGLESAIGVNTGFVFCGCVGSDSRRVYTVIGDAVNAAARLMSEAKPGQVLAGPATVAGAGGTVVWDAHAPLTLTGKFQPAAVHAARQARDRGLPGLHEPAATSALVGRGDELRRARAIVERVRGGRGHVLAITGEAGIGKSRLLTEVAASATTLGFVAYAGACEALGEDVPYRAWRAVWRALLRIDDAQDLDDQVEHVGATLAAADASWPKRTPLLAPVLNLPIPDNDLTHTFDSKLRAESLHSLLLAFLRQEAAGQPLLLALEDCQWIDPPSLELLELLSRNTGDLPVLFLLAYRPPTGPDPFAQVRRAARFEELSLPPLEPDETHDLLRLRVDGRDGSDGEFPAALAKELVAKSEGNPFYLEELVDYVSELGADRGKTALESLELPGSLHSLVLARIDQLGEPEKATLRVASVIGRTFRARWVWGSYPPLGTPAEVSAYLHALSRLDLISLERAAPDEQYIFKHGTIQEVAYGSLAFSTRELLHERVGRFVEETYAADLAQYLDVLAHHFGRSTDTEKQRIYLLRAGAAAKAAYANDAAVGYYERLLPLLPDGERSDTLCELGDVFQLVGRSREAERAYREALNLAEAAGADPAAARAEAALGRLLSFTSSFAEGIAWLERAREKLERLGASSLLCSVLEHLGTTYFWRSDYERALACANEHLKLAEELDDEIARSTAAENLGLVRWHRGEHELALEHFEDALRLARSGGYKVGVVHATNDAAGLFWERGDYARAIAHLDEALEIATEIGYERMACSAIGNAGRVRLAHGDPSGALACYAHALRLAARLSSWRDVHAGVAGIGLVCAARGRYADAERLLDEAILIARAVDERWLLGDYIFEKARLGLRSHRFAETERLAEEALEIGSAVNPREMELRARLLLLRVRAAVGKLAREEAVATLERLAAECADQGDRAAVLFELTRLDPKRHEERETAAAGYRELYISIPKAEFRRRHERLTGETLPDPPPLPPLPEVVSAQPASLDDLVDEAVRVTALARGG